MLGCFVHMYVCLCTMCASGVQEGQKRASNSLELELCTTGGYKSLCGGWESNLCPLRVSSVLTSLEYLFIYHIISSLGKAYLNFLPTPPQMALSPYILDYIILQTQAYQIHINPCFVPFCGIRCPLPPPPVVLGIDSKASPILGL